MTTFERKRARVMYWLFAAGWVSAIGGFTASMISRSFAWWAAAPFLLGCFLVFVSGPFVNGQLWRWMSRNWFGGAL